MCLQREKKRAGCMFSVQYDEEITFSIWYTKRGGVAWMWSLQSTLESTWRSLTPNTKISAKVERNLDREI